MHFSSNIKFLRELSGYTQRQLEDLLNLKKGSYSAYESKSVYPRMPIILALNDLFAQYYQGLTLDDLIKKDLRIAEEENSSPIQENEVNDDEQKDLDTLKKMFLDDDLGATLMDKYIKAITYK